MDRFEFCVPGPPVSAQARNPARLQAWKAEVRKAAEAVWPPAGPPTGALVMMVTTYYFEGAAPRLDADNMVKPIQDALESLVYVNDRQVRRTTGAMVPIGELRISDVSVVVAEALSTGEEFLHIAITPISNSQDVSP